MADIFNDPVRFQKEYSATKAELSKHFQYKDFFLQKNTFTGEEIKTPMDFELFLHCLAVKQIAEKNAASPTFTLKPPSKAPRWLLALTGLLAALLVVAGMATLHYAQLAETTMQKNRVYIEESTASSSKETKALQKELDEANEEITALKNKLDRATKKNQRNESFEDEPPSEAEIRAAEGPQYVLNTNTMRFHLVDCPSVNDIYDQNLALSDETRSAIISSGYTPCQQCNP